MKLPTKIIILFAILLGSSLIVPSHFAAQAQSAPFVIKLSFVPSEVESGKTIHKIGYVGITSTEGMPVYAPSDLEIQLQSEDETVAGVPKTVVIPSGQDHARFDVSVTDTVGAVEISAFFGDQISTQNFRVVPPQSQVPQDVDLVINLPSTQMQIGSEMPFSVYLENNGTMLQAPADIIVSFDYERPLVKLNSDRLVIEKGNYYSIGTIRALEKSGNAFIKATTSEPLLSTVANLQIAQTQPASLKVDVFPDDIGPGENTIDIFISLLDSEGSPTLAAQDVNLELFANSTSILNLGQINAVIEKGSFGFHQRLSVRAFTEQNVELGASASGLGVDTDSFKIVVENLGEGHPKAEIKALQVFTVDNVPSEGTSVVVYQLNAVETDDDDDTDTNGDGVVDEDDFHPIDDLEDGELYPIQASKFFSKEQGNLFIASSDNSAAKVVDYGTLPAGRSYGTATISSGRQTDSVDISVSLAGGASETGSLNIKGGLNPVKTLIFSPAGKADDGNYRMLFDQEGYSDLFFIALDSEGRPAASENGVKYLVKPINELGEIEAGKSFGSLVVRSSAFGSDDDISQITASPVGVNADSNLEVASDLHLIFFAGSVAKAMLPFNSIIGVSKSYDLGTVQLLDSFGNPLVPSTDLVARLSSSNPAVINVPDKVTIKQGTSYVQFPITTFGKAGNALISSSVEGVQSSSLELSSVLLKMKAEILPKERLRASVPSNITVSTVEGASVFWGVPSAIDVKLREERASTYDPETNSYLANLQIVASKPGNYTIDVTLLKDGFETTRLSENILINPYVSELQTFIEYPEDTIPFKQQTTITVTIEDENGQPIEDALVRLDSRDNESTVVPTSARTDDSGTATFAYTATGANTKTTLSATASKEGYSDGEDTKQLDVTGVPTTLPFWATYAAIAGVVASIGGGVVYFLKRPKGVARVDEEIDEDEEEEHL